MCLVALRPVFRLHLKQSVRILGSPGCGIIFSSSTPAGDIESARSGVRFLVCLNNANVIVSKRKVGARKKPNKNTDDHPSPAKFP